MATLVSKVRSITGSTTELSSNAEVLEFLEDGYDYIINVVPPQYLMFAATDSSNITVSTGYDLKHSRVVSVRRNSFPATEIPESMVYSQLLPSESMYAATTVFPVFYQRSGKVYIKPDPSASQAGVVTLIGVPSLTSATTSSVFRQVDAIAVLYAAALDCMAVSGYWSEQLVTSYSSTNTSANFRDGILKAKYLIDASTQLTQGQDLEYYLQQEDTEMMDAIIATARQELERAMAEIQKDGNTQRITYQYFLKSRDLFMQADSRLNAFLRRQYDPAGSDGASGQQTDE